MPKGKKFDAAEKHFKKKEENQRRIKELESTIKQLKTDMHHLGTEAALVKSENDSLKDWGERLLVYTELSKEDIRAVCEQDKKRDEALISLAGMSKALRGYF